MSRGQQGIGISAAGMYGQLTTGKPVKIISPTGPKASAHFFEVQIDTKKNEPLVHENKQIEWNQPRGTQVAIEVEGRYQKGRASVDESLEQTSIANAHVRLIYRTPEGEIKEYPPRLSRIAVLASGDQTASLTASNSGCCCRMLQEAKSQTLSSFLSSDFCRVTTDPRGRNVQSVEGLTQGEAPGHSRRDSRNPLSHHSIDEDHGSADELPFADWRKGDSLASTNRSKGILYGYEPSLRLSRQSFHH